MIDRSVFVVIAPADRPGIQPRSSDDGDAFACSVLTYDERVRITYASEKARAILRPILGSAKHFTAHVSGVTYLRGDGTELPAADFPVLRSLLTGETQRGQRLGIRNVRGKTLWLLSIPHYAAFRPHRRRAPCRTTPRRSQIVVGRPRGISSVGRALAWHARGQEFESPILHQIDKARTTREFFFLPDADRSRMMRERRTLDHRAACGEESPGFIGRGGG